ncbi:MAG: hypothetical protein ACYDBB_24690 [Armatimonadota bacterium]
MDEQVWAQKKRRIEELQGLLQALGPAKRQEDVATLQMKRKELADLMAEVASPTTEPQPSLHLPNEGLQGATDRLTITPNGGLFPLTKASPEQNNTKAIDLTLVQSQHRQSPAL